MESEILSLLLWVNATLSAGIVIALLLRVPVRRFAGARIAYALWLLPPAAFVAWLAPARQIAVALQPRLEPAGAALTAAAPELPAFAIIICWLAGIAIMTALYGLRQRGFVRAAGALQPLPDLGAQVFSAAPTHGPAVVGALRPVIVLPRDFGARFTAEEQALVLAHERAHVDRGDPLINAAALALRAINWFNPLVHIAAHALRLDQELACDAAVLARHAGGHRIYAEAMLKSHAAAFEVPVGCAWHATEFHPLKERIMMLTSSPSLLNRRLGLSLITVAAVGVCAVVWLLRPVEVLAAPSDAQAVAGAAAGTGDTAAALSEAETAVGDVEAATGEAEAEVITAEVDFADTEAEMEDQRIAMADVQRHTAAALADADAAIAAAQRTASVAAQRAAKDAHAAAEQALREARPAIAAAREAAKSARRAMMEARRATSPGPTSQCRRALARWQLLDVSTGAELKSLEKLICIPSLPNEPAPKPQN